MSLTRSDGTTFTVATAREEMPSSLPIKKRREYWDSLQRVHNSPYATYQRKGPTVHLLLSFESGYSIADCALPKLGRSGVVLWVEEHKATDQTVIVLSENGRIEAETIMESGQEIDSLLMFQLNNIESVRLLSYGNIPESIEGTLNDSDVEVVDLETPLIDEIAPLSAFEFHRAETVIGRLTARDGISAKSKLLGGAALSAIVVLFVISDEEKIRKQKVSDPFREYREYSRRPAASDILHIAESKLTLLSNFTGWAIDTCKIEMAKMACQMRPFQAASMELLIRQAKEIDESVEINPVKSNAEVRIDFDLNTLNQQPDDVIVPHRYVVPYVRDRLVSMVNPDFLEVDKVEDHGNWKEQSISISTSGAGLYPLALIAESVDRAPVKLSNVAIENKVRTVNVSATLSTYGGK